MQRVAIHDLDDPRLAAYRNLKDAELRLRQQRFVVEGRGGLAVLLERSRFEPESILLSERTECSLAAELARWRPGCPVYVAPQRVLDAVVGFAFHRGCVAVCRRPPLETAATLARRALADGTGSRLLLLEGLVDLDNVGSLFRSAMAFGVGGVVLCPRCADPLYRKSVRTSMGGVLCVPFARADEREWPTLLSTLSDLGYVPLALDPRGEPLAAGGASDLAGAPLALVVGSEGPGLAPATRAAARRRLRIGMASGVDSLNVAVAGAIALHALRPKENEA